MSMCEAQNSGIWKYAHPQIVLPDGLFAKGRCDWETILISMPASPAESILRLTSRGDLLPGDEDEYARLSSLSRLRLVDKNLKMLPTPIMVQLARPRNADAVDLAGTGMWTAVNFTDLPIHNDAVLYFIVNNLPKPGSK